MTAEKRDNKLSMFTPFSNRWNSAPILFRCKNCKHKYLVDIAARGYCFMDIAMRRSENSKKFWNDEFKCPKCKIYSPPMVWIFEPNSNRDEWKTWMKPISTDKEKLLGDMKKVDADKMIILDDYKMLLPIKMPVSMKKKLFAELKKYNTGIKIKFIKFKNKP